MDRGNMEMEMTSIVRSCHLIIFTSILPFVTFRGLRWLTSLCLTKYLASTLRLGIFLITHSLISSPTILELPVHLSASLQRWKPLPTVTVAQPALLTSFSSYL